MSEDYYRKNRVRSETILINLLLSCLSKEKREKLQMSNVGNESLKKSRPNGVIMQQHFVWLRCNGCTHYKVKPPNPTQGKTVDGQYHCYFKTAMKILSEQKSVVLHTTASWILSNILGLLIQTIHPQKLQETRRAGHLPTHSLRTVLL